MKYTEKGRPYFVDHNTRTTTFTDPRFLQQKNQSPISQVTIIFYNK